MRHRPRPKLWLLLGAVWGLTVCLWSCGAPGVGPQRARGQPVGDMLLPDAAGRTVRFHDLIERKAVLVDFWASWCAPCIEAMPHLQELHERYQSRGFAVVGVMIDRNATRIGPELVRKNNTTYPTLLDDDAQASEQALGPVGAIPLLLLLDQEGRLVEVFEGYTDPRVLERAVAALLAQPPTGA